MVEFHTMAMVLLDSMECWDSEATIRDDQCVVDIHWLTMLMLS